MNASRSHQSSVSVVGPNTRADHLYSPLLSAEFQAEGAMLGRSLSGSEHGRVRAREERQQEMSCEGAESSVSLGRDFGFYSK